MEVYFSIFLTLFGLVSTILNYIIYTKVSKTCSNDSTVKYTNIGQFVMSICIFLIGIGLYSKSGYDGFAFG